jgi:hypothetical protein
MKYSTDKLGCLQLDNSRFFFRRITEEENRQQEKGKPLP